MVDGDVNRAGAVSQDSHRRYYLNGALMDEWDCVIMKVRRWSERAGHSRQGHDAKDTVPSTGKYDQRG